MSLLFLQDEVGLVIGTHHDAHMLCEIQYRFKLSNMKESVVPVHNPGHRALKAKQIERFELNLA